ncbi:NAD-dependent epimerase/dehydratase family protein [Symbioplanes lichenis]|uniref:NAD-dependent epimerase/dehydratase family protein n=1 Tax=Symbioplanes lichenis TaxID=1629072 RepID=UPI002738D0BC|nr:NAD-dependent epimerase/dehydratase family protein [Actinoplanes lichenis]
MDVILGAGPVGTAVAQQLIAQDRHVRVITRSGSGPASADRVAADVADQDRLITLTRGSDVIYNCVNPPYTAWPKAWPPMSAAMIAAARAHDAVLAITAPVYAYGSQPGGHMTEHTPLAAVGRKGRIRRAMWEDARAAGIRTVEVRGADYLGARTTGVFSAVLAPAVAKGRTAWMPADLDAPHSWTYAGDMATALVTLARDDRSWGNAWHAPTHTGLSIRDLAGHFFAVTGAPEVPLRRMPRWMMRRAGLLVPMARELAEMDYQFYGPFLLDTTETDRVFGLPRTDLDTVLREEAASLKGGNAVDERLDVTGIMEP